MLYFPELRIPITTNLGVTTDIKEILPNLFYVYLITRYLVIKCVIAGENGINMPKGLKYTSHNGVHSKQLDFLAAKILFHKIYPSKHLDFL